MSTVDRPIPRKVQQMLRGKTSFEIARSINEIENADTQKKLAEHSLRILATYIALIQECRKGGTSLLLVPLTRHHLHRHNGRVATKAIKLIAQRQPEALNAITTSLDEIGSERLAKSLREMVSQKRVKPPAPAPVPLRRSAEIRGESIHGFGQVGTRQRGGSRVGFGVGMD